MDQSLPSPRKELQHNYDTDKSEKSEAALDQSEKLKLSKSVKPLDIPKQKDKADQGETTVSPKSSKSPKLSRKKSRTSKKRSPKSEKKDKKHRNIFSKMFRTVLRRKKKKKQEKYEMAIIRKADGSVKTASRKRSISLGSGKAPYRRPESQPNLEQRRRTNSAGIVEESYDDKQNNQKTVIDEDSPQTPQQTTEQTPKPLQPNVPPIENFSQRVGRFLTSPSQRNTISDHDEKEGRSMTLNTPMRNQRSLTFTSSSSQRTTRTSYERRSRSHTMNVRDLKNYQTRSQEIEKTKLDIERNRSLTVAMSDIELLKMEENRRIIENSGLSPKQILQNLSSVSEKESFADNPVADFVDLTKLGRNNAISFAVHRATEARRKRLPSQSPPLSLEFDSVNQNI